jgi:hypothetical protein
MTAGAPRAASGRCGRRGWSVGLSLLALVAVPALAQRASEPTGPLAPLAFRDPRLGPTIWAVPQGDPAVLGPERPEVAAGLARLEAASLGTGRRWQGLVDARSGRLVGAEGAPIPWASGRGNQLRGVPATTSGLAASARNLVAELAPALGVELADLVVSTARSGPIGDSLWTIELDLVREGLVVEGARVVFRIGHGNLIQFGSELLPDPEAAVPPRVLDLAAAREVAAARVGGFTAGDQFLDPGSELLLPALVPLATAEAGEGIGLLRAWSFTFRRRGVSGTWRTRIDATTGEWLELLNLERHGRVTGGIFLTSPVEDAEVNVPMPYADAAPSPPADGGGIVSGTGPNTTTLNGPFVTVDDQCGQIALTSDWKGDLALGISGGSDCLTPGFGGAGNTAAARTQFYYLNRAKEVARGWLPSVAWLGDPLEVATNIEDECNASWDGSRLNFFRSGGGCGNTGEIAAIALHEFGHALDDYDGNSFSPDFGTGETYGDITAALFTRSSCIGPGFQGSPCAGYGVACNSCTGVRDIDWAQRADNTPHTVENFTRVRCPSAPGYAGPCGREGHCESYVSSEAVWDFAARDLSSPGSAAAWATTERLWMLSRPTATAAFACNNGAAPWTSNGCNIGSLWKTMRAADDDDGNLANGTPNSCHLYAAFDRHGIACPADPGANVCFAGCTPPLAPSLVALPGPERVDLSWASAGPGQVYDLYRSELGCDGGWVPVATNLAGTTYQDLTVQPGFSYRYRVAAHPSGNAACTSPPSSCQTAVPTEGSCTAPAAPATLTATATSVTTIQLDWPVVPGAAGYVVYRSAAPAGPYTAIGSTASNTYTDAGLDGGASWSYRVRSFSGRCDSGDSPTASAVTEPCVWMPVADHDFGSGSGLLDWTTWTLPGHTGAANSWRGRQSCTQEVFRYGGATCGGDYGLDEAVAVRPPAVAVALEAAKTRARIDHRFSFETDWDGGALAVAVDGGSFAVQPPGRMTGAVAGGDLAVGCEPAGWASTPIFTGTQGTVEETVLDLDPACNQVLGGTAGCAGHQVELAFLALTDCFVTADGWFLDRVRVEVCRADPLREEDFEDGSVDDWDF